MARCEVCGSNYDKAFELSIGGTTHVFDSFECAIHAVAPRCPHCGCAIIGHGVEAADQVFCCAHCARQSRHEQVSDRATS
jgi:nitrite reductase/ring-hydroxylating ferredoxin subunit